MTQRYEHRPAGDKWAIFDNRVGRVIGHLRSLATADQIVSELNKMEAADAA